MPHFDLCIVGTGSGNSIVDDRFDHLTVALVEMGAFGGTCLNVGCIPSKMLVHPADLAASTVHANKLGVDLDLHLLHLGQHGDRRCGGVQPPTTLRLRHPLHPVWPTLELEVAEGAPPLDLQDHLPKAMGAAGSGRQDLYPPALLLGVAFDPEFSTNSEKNFVYVYYTVPGDPPHNRISRFRANGDTAVPNSQEFLFDLNDLSDAQNHNGGAIHFGPDHKLYAAVGENAHPANSQSLDNLLGKILRLNADGTIPDDNPFHDEAKGKNRAIWALVKALEDSWN